MLILSSQAVLGLTNFAFFCINDVNKGVHPVINMRKSAFYYLVNAFFGGKYAT